MSLDIDDFTAIANAILDAVSLSEQKKSFDLIKEKLDQLSLVEFRSNADIQKQYILSIGKLKQSRDRMRKKANNYEPVFRSAWLKLADMLDERIELLKRKKRLNANGIS